MRIVTLIENLVYKKDLVAEHGLSFYIETDNKKIIFDTGQTGNFLKNAVVLGVDIPEIDTLVLSHGHYDHTGGLYPFLQANSKAKVYAKKEVFFRKYHGTDRFIGTVYDSEALENRIHFVNEKIQIDQDIFIMPDIPIDNPLDTHFKHFKIQPDNGYEDDEFNDELFLAITHNKKLSVISSCSHRGITNIVDAAKKQFNLPVNMILGGFHLIDAPAEQYEAIRDYFRKTDPKLIGVCHCTGMDNFSKFLRDFKSSVFYNHTGKVLEIY
jgi:7,8-dihydropterin-6-yl-methyl-4-(beta-D-ribofuranosyl)aminobenzene 5'-phosphate synthase